MCVTNGPSLEPRTSPKSHTHLTIVRPAPAVEPAALKVTSWPGAGAVGEMTKLAVGRFAKMVCTCVDDAVRPRSSVMVRVIAAAPALLKTFVTNLPEPVPPPVNVQSYRTIVRPGPTFDVDASN